MLLHETEFAYYQSKNPFEAQLMHVVTFEKILRFVQRESFK